MLAEEGWPRLPDAVSANPQGGLYVNRNRSWSGRGSVFVTMAGSDLRYRITCGANRIHSDRYHPVLVVTGFTAFEQRLDVARDESRARLIVQIDPRPIPREP
jgi:hypothetical protein